MTSRPDTDQSKIDPARGLDAEFLRKTTDELIEALTSPAYIEAVRAVRVAPEDKRMLEASKRLTPEALRALGVPLPAGMRISSRYFETGFPDSIDVELGDAPEGGVNLINALNKAKPGLLDDLRANNAEIFKTLISPQETTGPQTPRIGYCNCGGHDFSGPLVSGTVCGGAGAHVM